MGSSVGFEARKTEEWPVSSAGFGARKAGVPGSEFGGFRVCFSATFGRFLVEEVEVVAVGEFGVFGVCFRAKFSRFLAEVGVAAGGEFGRFWAFRSVGLN